MKTIRMILLSAFTVAVNTCTAILCVLFFSDIDLPEGTIDVAWLALLIGIFFALVCGIYAIATHRKVALNADLQKGLGVPIFFFKLSMLPFFALGTLIGIFLIFASGLLTLSIKLAGAGIVLGAMTPVYLLILTIINYLFVLATSAFSISAILIEYKKRSIKLPATVIFIILQLIPFVDIISYLPIALHFRSIRNGKTPPAGVPPMNQNGVVTPLPHNAR